MPEVACPDCTQAAARPWHGFTAGCRACAARSIAIGPDFATARKTGRQHWGYRSALEQLGVTHAEVVAASKEIAPCRATPHPPA